MSHRIALFLSLNILFALGLVATIGAQEPAAAKGGKGAPGGGKAKAVAARPGIFLREVWKQLPTNAEHALDQTAIASPDLQLTILNNTGEGMQMTGTTGLDGNPPHMWTGVNEGPTAAMFKHKTKYADLTGLARIKANIKTSGFHQVRPVVRLANGTYLVGDQGVGTFTDWLNYEWAVGDLRWLTLDPKRVVTTGTFVNNPDLSKVDEIGFADLMPGSGHGAGGWVDVAEVEVYANSVSR